ncbi:MAG: bifunctional nuclease family protein [Chlorobi bacterium]|nr:bifunctional nuclease family protein [Chlorobiota bacterium]
MKKVKLEIVGMSYSQSQSGAYALVLGVPGEKKRLPIIIGGFEAQAIAIELEKMKPTRPLTHDLFKNFALHFGIRLKEVIINDFVDGIFYSKLVCITNDGDLTELDSRTSDAVALALRFNCPIFAEAGVMEEAGIIMEEGDESVEVLEKPHSPQTKYSDYLLPELEEMLAKAVENENFEEASKIRDEIKRRQNK